MALRLGIDVGGAFTDLFLHDDETGSFWIRVGPGSTGGGARRRLVSSEPARVDFGELRAGLTPSV